MSGGDRECATYGIVYVVVEQKFASSPESHGEALVFTEAFFGNAVVLRVLVVLAERYQAQRVVLVADGQLVTAAGVNVAGHNFVVLDDGSVSVFGMSAGMIVFAGFATYVC